MTSLHLSKHSQESISSSSSSSTSDFVSAHNQQQHRSLGGAPKRKRSLVESSGGVDIYSQPGYLDPNSYRERLRYQDATSGGIQIEAPKSLPKPRPRKCKAFHIESIYAFFQEKKSSEYNLM